MLALVLGFALGALGFALSGYALKDSLALFFRESHKRIALGIEPLEIEQWLKAVKREEDLENPTVDKMRRVMSLVYKSGMRYGLIPRDEESNPLRFVRCETQSEYRALVLTPKQAFDLFIGLPEADGTICA